jgi:hypothetical protein
MAAKKPGTILWGALDHETGRLFSDESGYSVRKGAITQATVQTIVAPVFLLVAFILVVPGLYLLWLYWNLWKEALALPSYDEIEAGVEAIRTTGRVPTPVVTSAVMA